MTPSATVTTIASKENLARILDNLKEGVIAHDLQRRIFFFNAAAERITGFSRREVLNRDCHDVFDGPFCGQRCSFCDGAPSPAEHTVYPLTVISKTGEPRRIELTATLMRGDGGEPVGVLAAFSDLTQLFDC